MTKREWTRRRNKIRNNLVGAIPALIIWAGASALISGSFYLVDLDFGRWWIGPVLAAVMVALISEKENQ